jgi:hypothetical protein
VSRQPAVAAADPGRDSARDDHSHQHAAQSESRCSCSTRDARCRQRDPDPLAQLDFAGLINTFDIDSGDSPRALLVIAGVGGVLTIGVLAIAFAGAALALAGAAAASTVLITAALAGLITAMPLWIPAGVLIAAAALLLQPREQHTAVPATPRNLLRPGGVSTHNPRRGEA